MKTEAFPELEKYLRQSRQMLLVRCNNMLHSWADSEEAVQEAAYNAFRARVTYDPSIATIDRWFATILKNCCYDILKKRRTSGEVFESFEDDAMTTRQASFFMDIESAEATVIEESSQKRMADLLQRLAPDDHIQLFEMLAGGHVDREEVARNLGITDEALRQRVHRGREHMEHRLISVVDDIRRFMQTSDCLDAIEAALDAADARAVKISPAKHIVTMHRRAAYRLRKFNHTNVRVTAGAR